LSAAGRPLLLALEMVFTRDQRVLDEWQRDATGNRELRHRLRFDAEWGYAWEPVLHLLETARSLAVPIFGVDCHPRGDLRRISARDRHAADKLAHLRATHPGSQMIVLFGESHLAPSHLPAELHRRLPGERVHTLLQNNDALYWRAAGELRQP